MHNGLQTIFVMGGYLTGQITLKEIPIYLAGQTSLKMIPISSNTVLGANRAGTGGFFNTPALIRLKDHVATRDKPHSKGRQKTKVMMKIHQSYF